MFQVTKSDSIANIFKQNKNKSWKQSFLAYSKSYTLLESEFTSYKFLES